MTEPCSNCGYPEVDDVTCEVCDPENWIDITPLASRRYVLQNRVTGQTRDGGRIPLRRDLHARWNYFRSTGSLTPIRDLTRRD